MILNDENMETTNLLEYIREHDYELMWHVKLNDLLNNFMLLDTFKYYGIDILLSDESVYASISHELIKLIQEKSMKLINVAKKESIMYVFRADQKSNMLKRMNEFNNDVDFAKTKQVVAYVIENQHLNMMSIYQDIIDIARFEDVKTIYLADSDFKFDQSFFCFMSECIINDIQLVSYYYEKK